MLTQGLRATLCVNRQAEPTLACRFAASLLHAAVAARSQIYY